MSSGPLPQGKCDLLLVGDGDLEAILASVAATGDKALVLSVEQHCAVVHEGQLLQILLGQLAEHSLSLGSLLTK